MLSRLCRTFLAAVATMALVATATPPAQAADSTYVALGDSFSAGTGTRAKVDSCYRSPYGYPKLVDAQLGLALDYQACSGATTADVAARQLGTLSANTAIVTMTIGGNDVGFADVITECALPWWISNCTRAINSGYAILNTQMPGRYNSLFGSIATRAPNADVAIGGYPRLFNGKDCSWATFFSRSEMSKLNKATDDLDALVANRSAAHGFTYVDPRSAFIGHAVCDRAEWINGLSYPIEESFHPNRSGNSAYASLFAPAVAPVAARQTTAPRVPATLTAAPSLRQQADRVLAMRLDSRKHLKQAKAAGIKPRKIRSLTKRLRSKKAAVVKRALTKLHAIDKRGEVSTR